MGRLARGGSQTRACRLALSAAVVGLALAGCATSTDGGLGGGPSSVAQGGGVEEAPLGGEALAQRRSDLERAWRDMVSFHVTLRTLVDREDEPGISVFDDFVFRYINEHLDPMLVGRWQSSHPEVMVDDANLRLIKAELQSQLDDSKGAQRTLQELAARFAGREQMLVESPTGEQRPLLEALNDLRRGKWSRPPPTSCEESVSLKECLRATF